MKKKKKNSRTTKTFKRTKITFSSRVIYSPFPLNPTESFMYIRKIIAFFRAYIFYYVSSVRGFFFLLFLCNHHRGVHKFLDRERCEYEYILNDRGFITRDHVRFIESINIALVHIRITADAAFKCVGIGFKNSSGPRFHSFRISSRDLRIESSPATLIS